MEKLGIDLHRMSYMQYPHACYMHHAVMCIFFEKNGLSSMNSTF